MACLLGMLGIGLGMPYEDLPGDDDVGDFLDNILTNQGEAILDKVCLAILIGFLYPCGCWTAARTYVRVASLGALLC